MSYKGRRIGVVIPAYNEENHIGDVLSKVPEEADFVLVMDDGSRDKTKEIAEKKGAVVLRNNPNRGYSYSLKRGYKEALKRGAEIVVHFDGDGQHKPEEMFDVMSPIIEGEADYVLGSRLLNYKGGMPLTRFIGNKAISFIARVYTGFEITDSTTGYTAITKEALEKSDISSLGEGKWDVDTDLILKVAEHDLKIKEVPITCLYADEHSNISPVTDTFRLTIPFITFTLKRRFKWLSDALKRKTKKK